MEAVSPPEAQAWFLLNGDDETASLEHPWPAPREGDLQFVIDEALAGLSRDAQLALYQDLAEKMLAAFRALIPPEGWLYALDYHHTSYRLFPHVPFETGATLEEMTGNYNAEHFAQAQQGIHPPPFAGRWPVSIHADGDPQHYFAPPDFRFVFAARYNVRNREGGGLLEVETYELRGRDLVEAVERNLPELFRRGRRSPLHE
jgi:hypothetical protein